MKLLIHFTLILILISCADLGKKDQLIQISTIEKHIDSMSIVLTQHPIEKVEELQSVYVDLEYQIKNYQSNMDSISLDLARKFDELKWAKAAFEPLKKTFVEISLSLKESEKNIKILKLDIEESNGERENYEKNIQFESQKAQSISLLLKSYTEESNRATQACLSNFDALRSFVQKIHSENP